MAKRFREEDAASILTAMQGGPVAAAPVSVRGSPRLAAAAAVAAKEAEAKATQEALDVAHILTEQLPQATSAFQELNAEIPTDLVRIENPELGKLTKFLLAVLGQSAVAQIKAKYETARDFLEKTGATTQCNNVIGPWKGKSCWICKFPIPDVQPMGFSPECEHVLPVAQAIFFVGLYQSPEDQANPKWMEALKLEYGWAHRVCNQEKRDAHPVYLDPTTQTWKVSRKQVELLLKTILKSKKYYAPGQNPLRDQLNTYPKGKDWFKDRADEVTQRYESILTYVREKGEGLTVLSGVAVVKGLYDEFLRSQPHDSSSTGSVSPPPAKKARGRKTRRNRRKTRKTRRQRPS